MPSTRPLAHLVTRAAALASLAALAACATDAPTSSLTDDAAVRAEDVRDRAANPTADPTTAAERWVVVARQIFTRRELVGPLGITRSFAILSVAQYDAEVAAAADRDRDDHWGDKARGPKLRPTVEGAAAGAAAAVLAALYPAEQALIDSQYMAEAARPAGKHESFAAGVEIGRAVAAAALARAATDRTTLPFTGTIPVGPGFWRSAPAPAQPLAPRWGEARPWLLGSGDQFRPAPPPAYGSPEFNAALAEIRTLSDTRTPAQLATAQFWAVSASGGPMGYWTGLGLDLARSHQYGERRTARLLAVMHMAVMDASIGCWDGKYAYWYVRPFQADPAITTPVGRPNFPSYPSAHSCLSAAAAGVLERTFHDAAPGLRAQVAEAGVARMYAGLHYAFDVQAGQELGDRVAQLAMQRAPRHGEPISLK